ncbi:MAG: thermonuclease family protein [Chloroflexota bacterium]|nr:thermonuclease family protein [Anaerolineae bacterium]
MIGVLLLAGCTFGFDPGTPTGSTGSTGGSVDQGGDTAQVTRIIDGDTIDVKMANGTTERVRYIGMNTPESDQVCYSEATQANSIFVSGKSVRMVKDISDRDVYGRLLRYVYVGDLFVNRALVEQGYAEAVLYDPDRAHYDEFVTLEKQATAANRGCHPSGIFNDGSYTR